jgi:hypothetical protein
MSDPHTLEGQAQRATRLREQIENLKSGKQPERPEKNKSLREQVEERASEIRKGEAIPDS